MSLAWSVVALRGLSVSRVVPTHMAAGEATVLRYRLEHRNWLPSFAVVVRENWGRGSKGWKRAGPTAGGAMLGGPPQAWVLHLPARQTVTAAAPCRPRQRGKLCFERLEVSTSFPFSIVHKSVEFTLADEVVVFPHLYRVRRGRRGSAARSVTVHCALQ